VTTTDERTAMDDLVTAVAHQDPPDPFGVDGADVKIGDTFRAHSEDPCNQRLAGAPGGSYAYCRRPKGHDPRHPHFETEDASSRIGSRVRWVWGKGEAPLVEVADEFADPDDAKLESYEEGTFASYRDKRRVLMVLSRPRKGDEGVEVLDLTHQRFLKVSKDKLVPRRDDDPAITPEQFEWVGKWLADRRKKALEVAKRELGNGRWNRSTMNESLEKLDIAPLPAKYGGTVEFTIRFEFPNGARLGRDEARRLVEQAVIGDHEGVKITQISNWYGGNPTEIPG
jgi:hypothetical protein